MSLGLYCRFGVYHQGLNEIQVPRDNPNGLDILGVRFHVNRFRFVEHKLHEADRAFIDYAVLLLQFVNFGLFDIYNNLLIIRETERTPERRPKQWAR